jgi:hypothetical protein
MLATGFNVESVLHEDMKFTLWDVGGAEKVRKLCMLSSNLPGIWV